MGTYASRPRMSDTCTKNKLGGLHSPHACFAWEIDNN